jgi:hypothetical protein
MTTCARLIAALALLALVTPNAPAADKAKKLSEADVLKLVQLLDDEDAVAARVRKAGVDFKADEAALARLKKASVPAPVLAAVKAVGGEPGKATADGEPLATAEHDSGLIVEVTEVKPDDREMLTIRLRFRNPTERPITLIEQSGPFLVLGGRPNDRFLREVYYVEGKLDAGNAQRHNIVKATDGKQYSSYTNKDLDAVVVRPGKAFEFWAKFSLPAAKTRQLTLHLPRTPLIEKLPVQKKD